MKNWLPLLLLSVLIPSCSIIMEIRRDIHGVLIPIHEAVARNDEKSLDFLLQGEKERERANMTNRAGSAPIHIAAVKDRFNMVERLVRSRADLERKDLAGKTAMDLVVELKCFHTAEALVLANAKYSVEQGAMILAACLNDGYLQGAKYLINKRVTPGPFNVDKAYLDAAERGDKFLVEYLLGRGFSDGKNGQTYANLRDAKRPNDDNALLLACGAKDPDAARYLWGRTGDAAFVNRANSAGETSLTVALRSGQRDLANAFIRAGADVNVKNGEIFLKSVSDRDYDFVKFLISARANIRIQEDSAWKTAYTGSDLAMMAILLQSGLDPLLEKGKYWVDACKRGDLALVKAMAGTGKVSADAMNGEGLVVAAENGKAEVVAYLVDTLKANVNIQNGEPLARSYGNGHETVYVFLLDRGALSSIATESIFLKAAVNNNVTLMQKMLAKPGTSVNAEGSKALQLACERGNLEMLRLVLGTRGVLIPPNLGLVDKALGRNNLEVAQMLLDAGATFTTPAQEILRKAALLNSVWMVKFAVSKGANVNDENSMPLVEAAGKNSEDALRALIDAKANVNIATGKALLTAIRAGHEKVLALLLANGGDVNVGDGEIIRLAAKTGNINIVNLAIQYKANLNVKGGEPLLNAFRGKHTQVLRVLIEKGADVNVGGGELLLTACSAGDLALAKLLLERGGDANIKEGEGLALACASDNAELVKLLLTRGAKANGQNGKIFFIPVSRGKVDIATLMLDQAVKADSNFVNIENGKPIQIANENGFKDMIRFLADRGADVNAGQGVILKKTAAEKDVDLMKFLLDKKGDVNTGNGELLATACQGDHLEMAKLLVSRGARVDLREGAIFLIPIQHEQGLFVSLLADKGTGFNTNFINFGNGKPLLLAFEKKNKEIMQMLVVRGANPNAGDGKILIHYSTTGDAEFVKFLLESGALAGIANGEPIMAASENQKVPVVDLLLTHKADPNTRTGSPLLSAVKYNNEDLAALLLDRGADPNLQSGRAILESTRNDRIGLVRLLLGKKASLTVLDERQKSPIDMAFEKHNEEMVRLFEATNQANPRLIAASKELRYEDAKFVLSLGASPDFEDETGLSPLYHVYSRTFPAKPEMLERLIKEERDFVTLLMEHNNDLDLTQKKTKAGEIPYDVFVKQMTPMEAELKRVLDKSLRMSLKNLDDFKIVAGMDPKDLWIRYNSFRTEEANRLLASLRNSR